MTNSAEYWRGYEDGLLGAGPDYGQDTVKRMLDYIAGYNAGKRDAQKAEAASETVEAQDV